jgi:hypothetical protein
MTVLCILPLVLLGAEAGKGKAKPDRAALVKAARKVVAAVVEAGREDSRRAKPRKGDELTDYLVRAAAAAARKLPEKEAGPAFLLAVGVALDTSALLRRNPVTGGVWKAVESDAERAARLKVLGTPEVHGRHDLVQHFGVSAALTVVSGAKAAQAAGILKELLDAEPGGSGFSFADLAADLSGVVFAERVLAGGLGLLAVEKKFRGVNFVVGPKGLVEGLSRERFEKRYGSVRDPRFRKELEGLRKKAEGLPGYR